VVFSDAVIFFLFNGYFSVCIAVAIFTGLTFGFYRSSLLRSEWRISMTVAMNLFINNYSVIWPYTTYGLLRLEANKIQDTFVRSTDQNYNYQFIWCLLSLGMVPLLAFIRMSISISHIKELNRVKRQQSTDLGKLKTYRGDRVLASRSDQASEEEAEAQTDSPRKPSENELRVTRSGPVLGMRQ